MSDMAWILEVLFAKTTVRIMEAMMPLYEIVSRKWIITSNRGEGGLGNEDQGGKKNKRICRR
jgi:hypothetical protein